METNTRKKDVPIFLWRHVPTELPDILVDLTREILRHQPNDIHSFAANYFEKLYCLHKKLNSRAGAEVNEEQKEETTSEKDEVPVPSSPSQDTVVTVASSGTDKVPDSPTKTEAPLAREEESFTQQASPAAGKPKEETKPGVEAKTGDVEAPEPEVKELQRVNETKLEKEKTVDTSGVTTEKTVYTQVSESVRIQETKGPAVDPFASSQKTVFPPFSKSWHETKPQATESQTSPSYVHSVKVTESSYSSPSSPASAGSEAATPEKTQSVHEFSVSASGNVASVPEKVQDSLKSEVVEMATDVVESLNGSHTDEPQSEIPAVTSPVVPHEEQAQVKQEAPSIEAEVVYEEQVVDENERSDVEGAVVKIQAGIRGYLTRKSLKESRKDGPLMQSAKGGASVQPSSKQDEVPSEEPLVLNIEEMLAVTDDLIQEIDESDAAVKIQAMYRGYRTRKQLDELLNEPEGEEEEDEEEEEEDDDEIETLNVSAEQTESTVQENRRSPPDRSPVTVTENFVPILKAQVTITPPSSPTMEKEKNILSVVEVAPEDSQTSEIPEKSADTDETADDGEDDESKKQAATKIQAVFRGYKVRKTSRKEAPGNVKEISEGAKENRDDTPSPPLEPENDDDTLEDNAEDDIDEIPNVQWQTSELYADDSGPKYLHEHDESKTESITEEETAPVSDTPKTTQRSYEQVVISTAKITLGESHGSAMPTTAEDQHVKSDHQPNT